jgi:preprotein translocase SecE subunit
MSADNTMGEQPERRRRRPLAGKTREQLREEVKSESRAVSAKAKEAPARKERDDDEESKGGFFQRLVTGLRDYVAGVQSELKKTIWPTNEETRRLSVIVLTTLIISSIVLGAIVLLFTELFRLGLQNPVILIVFMLVAAVVGVVWSRMNSRQSAL